MEGTSCKYLKALVCSDKRTDTNKSSPNDDDDELGDPVRISDESNNIEELDIDGRGTAVPALKRVAHYEDVRGAGYGAAYS